MTTEFIPEFTVKATGHVIAEFKGEPTSMHLLRIFEWVKKEKWKGCLQVNFVGNGGAQSIKFAESPKPLKDEPELPY